jgi:sRNA-binding regulator protein Hfq
VIAVEGFSNTTDYLSELMGKSITLLLVNRDWRGSDVLSGTLTRIYSNAIVLTRQNSEQLIYLHAVAMIQETTSSEQPFQANIATVSVNSAFSTSFSGNSSGYDLPGKYIGE